MQIVIDIPKSRYKEIVSGIFDADGYFKTNLTLAFRNGTPIPDNVTNGDVIIAMFPDAEYKHIKTMSGIDGMEVNGINGLYDNSGQWCARAMFFHDYWWNAPYKGRKE